MTSIKEHCCGADLLFDEKTAIKQYKSYLKKGPSRVSKRIIGQMEKGPLGDSLIDVGGGIGAIQWWFLQNGGEKSYGIDASSGYSHLAKEHASKNNYEKSTQFLIGDFVDQKNLLPQVDHVTMDKVICCYPDYNAIIDLACQKATKSISLSYPMDGWIADAFRAIGVLVIKLKGIPFKPYIHRVSSLRSTFEKNGFKLKEQDLAFPWHVETYVKD